MKILISPLDWGLGHATRCIPLINAAINEGHEVLIACEDRPRKLLELEFPSIESINLTGIQIKYPKKVPMFLAMAIQFPRIILGIIREKKLIQTIVEKHSIDVVMSDNRFGVYSSAAYNIYMSHQLTIAAPKLFKFLEPIGYFIHSLVYKKYDCLVVPDYSHDSHQHLAGRLSVHKKNKAIYLGYLSRFENQSGENSDTNQKFDTDIFISLSGPEPSRTQLEDKLLSILKDTTYKVVITQGLPDIQNINSKFNSTQFTVFSHLQTQDYFSEISKAKLVIARSGYSSIMDFLCLQKNALLVPTPGQTEQEYLAEDLKEKKLFHSSNQFDLNIETIINALDNKIILENSNYKVSLEAFWKDIECKI